MAPCARAGGWLRAGAGAGGGATACAPWTWWPPWAAGEMFLHGPCAAGSAARLWLELLSVAGGGVEGFSAPRVDA